MSLVMFYLLRGGGFGNLPVRVNVYRSIIFIIELSPPQITEFYSKSIDELLVIIKSIHLINFY